MQTRNPRRRRLEIPTRVDLEGRRTVARDEAEAFVRAAFRAAYDARLTEFMPRLMTLRDDRGELLGVLGLRRPVDGPLFLEHYLDLSVEQRLAGTLGQPVDRASLVEVGNFAVGAAGGGRWLITALTAYLHSAGQRWAVFTCGPELRNAFTRLGVPLVDLAAADPGRLPRRERRRWGSYYAQQPRVMAANVADSHAVLATLFERECTLNALWRGALQAGRHAA
jgi:hypothetical protein